MSFTLYIFVVSFGLMVFHGSLLVFDHTTARTRVRPGRTQGNRRGLRTGRATSQTGQIPRSSANSDGYDCITEGNVRYNSELRAAEAGGNVQRDGLERKS